MAQPATEIRHDDEESVVPPVEQRSGPIPEEQTAFEFLERGARPEAVAIRQWMGTWFRYFPAEHRELLKRRLRLKGFAEFMSAYVGQTPLDRANRDGFLFPAG